VLPRAYRVFLFERDLPALSEWPRSDQRQWSKINCRGFARPAASRTTPIRQPLTGLLQFCLLPPRVLPELLCLLPFSFFWCPLCSTQSGFSDVEFGPSWRFCAYAHSLAMLVDGWASDRLAKGAGTARAVLHRCPWHCWAWLLILMIPVFANSFYAGNHCTLSCRSLGPGRPNFSANRQPSRRFGRNDQCRRNVAGFAGPLSFRYMNTNFRLVLLWPHIPLALSSLAARPAGAVSSQRKPLPPGSKTSQKFFWRKSFSLCMRMPQTGQIASDVLLQTPVCANGLIRISATRRCGRGQTPLRM